MKGLWRSAQTLSPGGGKPGSSRGESGHSRAKFGSMDSSVANLRRNELDDTSSTSVLESGYIRSGRGYSMGDINNHVTNPLECPRTRKMRRIEQQSEDLIRSSFSTNDESAEISGKAEQLTSYASSDNSLVHLEVEKCMNKKDHVRHLQTMSSRDIIRHEKFTIDRDDHHYENVIIDLEIHSLETSTTHEDIHSHQNSRIDQDIHSHEYFTTDQDIHPSFSDILDKFSDEEAEAMEEMFAMDHETTTGDQAQPYVKSRARYADPKVIARKPVIVSRPKIYIMEPHRVDVEYKSEDEDGDDFVMVDGSAVIAEE